MGLKRKRRAVSSFINKRTKAYKLHVEEVHRALRDWERRLNSICTDPAPILVENYVDLEGPPQVNSLISFLHSMCSVASSSVS
jgi:hypothetical protein